MNKVRNTIFLLISLFYLSIEQGHAIEVTFTIDEYAARTAGLSNAERNLAQLLIDSVPVVAVKSAVVVSVPVVAAVDVESTVSVVVIFLTA